MIDLPRTGLSLNYEVIVGHVRVCVAGVDRQEAIRRARIQLSLDMPRLYDVIHRLDESRFQVIALVSERHE